jgi:methionyl-tRNA synthetase
MRQLREVPRLGDADFTAARLVARANDDLANDLGNLVSRAVTLVHRYRQGKFPRTGASPGAPAQHSPAGRALAEARHQVTQRAAAALAAFDFRSATAAIWDVVEEANRYVERAEPWRLARAERDGDAASGARLDESLALLIGTCAHLGHELAPFLPHLAARIQAARDDSTGCPQPSRYSRGCTEARRRLRSATSARLATARIAADMGGCGRLRRRNWIGPGAVLMPRRESMECRLRLV